MNKLSAVIITRNEERNIGRCLETIKVVADDIVVVDALSNDRTGEICSSYNVNIITREWEGYSASKNFGNLQAKHDWILSIDADETLTEELAKLILKIKEEPEMSFCKFNRLTNYCGRWIRHCGWYPDRKVRIFDRRQAKWEGQVHEKLIFDKEIPVRFLNADCLHYSYYSIAEHISKMNTFTDIAALELLEKGDNGGFYKQIWKTKLKFLSVYFFKLGFLDGYYGFLISVLSAMSEFVKYGKLNMLRKGKNL